MPKTSLYLLKHFMAFYFATDGHTFTTEDICRPIEDYRLGQDTLPHSSGATFGTGRLLADRSVSP